MTARDLGVGIGLRRPHFDLLPRHLDAEPAAVDFVEVIAETFVGVGGADRRALENVRARVPVLAHGVSTSLGGPDALDRSWLSSLRGWLDALEIEAFSEHMCWSSYEGGHSMELLTLPFTSDAARWLGARARVVSEVLGRPLRLENVAYYAEPPTGGEPALDAVAFVSSCLDASGAGLLLDLGNLWVNARNHGRDAAADVAALPLDRVMEVHLAGSRFEPRWGVIVDDHASAVPEEVWSLYGDLVGRVGPITTLIEWDQSVPELETLLAEVVRARSVRDRALLERR